MIMLSRAPLTNDFGKLGAVWRKRARNAPRASFGDELRRNEAHDSQWTYNGHPMDIQWTLQWTYNGHSQILNYQTPGEINYSSPPPPPPDSMLRELQAAQSGHQTKISTTLNQGGEGRQKMLEENFLYIVVGVVCSA